METAGTVDVLIANLMARNNRRTADQIDDADWRRMFDVMVHRCIALRAQRCRRCWLVGEGRSSSSAEPTDCEERRSALPIAPRVGLRSPTFARSMPKSLRAGSASISSPRTGSPIRPPIRPRRPTPRSCCTARRRADWTGGAPRRECGTRPFSRVCEAQLHRWPSDPLCRWLGLTEREKL